MFVLPGVPPDVPCPIAKRCTGGTAGEGVFELLYTCIQIYIIPPLRSGSRTKAFLLMEVKRAHLLGMVWFKLWQIQKDLLRHILLPHTLLLKYKSLDLNCVLEKYRIRMYLDHSLTLFTEFHLSCCQIYQSSFNWILLIVINKHVRSSHHLSINSSYI